MCERLNVVTLGMSGEAKFPPLTSNKEGEGLLLDIVLGIVGAVVGGFLFNQLGAAGVTGFNIYSMFVAVVGAVIVLVIYHAVAGRRAVR